MEPGKAIELLERLKVGCEGVVAGLRCTARRSGVAQDLDGDAEALRLAVAALREKSGLPQASPVVRPVWRSVVLGCAGGMSAERAIERLGHLRDVQAYAAAYIASGGGAEAAQSFGEDAEALQMAIDALREKAGRRDA